MLEDLTIKDFAIIESEHIEFSKGFTVLSGETGAGKSIIIGAVSFFVGWKGGNFPDTRRLSRGKRLRNVCHSSERSCF